MNMSVPAWGMDKKLSINVWRGDILGEGLYFGELFEKVPNKAEPRWISKPLCLRDLMQEEHGVKVLRIISSMWHGNWHASLLVASSRFHFLLAVTFCHISQLFSKTVRVRLKCYRIKKSQHRQMFLLLSETQRKLPVVLSEEKQHLRVYRWHTTWLGFTFVNMVTWCLLDILNLVVLLKFSSASFTATHACGLCLLLPEFVWLKYEGSAQTPEDVRVWGLQLSRAMCSGGMAELRQFYINMLRQDTEIHRLCTHSVLCVVSCFSHWVVLLC